MSKIDLLKELKDIEAALALVSENGDKQSDYWLNKCRNQLRTLVVDGERRQQEKLGGSQTLLYGHTKPEGGW